MRKSLLILPLLIPLSLRAQQEVNDESIRYQQQRMVFVQWDQNKFTPKAGFLDLNPYYWLVWGLFDPDYHKTDLRPLAPSGPQTQRLAMVGVQNSEDNKYKLQSDTVKRTALSQIASQSGLLSDVDPLWLLYYKNQFSALLNYSQSSILGPLPPQVSRNSLNLERKDGQCDHYSRQLTVEGRLRSMTALVRGWFRLELEVVVGRGLQPQS